MNQMLQEPEVQSPPQTVEGSHVPDVPERPPVGSKLSQLPRPEQSRPRITRAPCSGGMGTCRFPMPKVLADAPALVIFLS